MASGHTKQLTKEEFETLRFQNETSKGRGGTRYLPHAFTEQLHRRYPAGGMQHLAFRLPVSDFERIPAIYVDKDMPSSVK